jgi:ABC-type transport system substrate-binding protein
VALLAGASAALSGRDDKPPEKKPAEKVVRTEEEDDTFKPGKPVLRVEEPDVVDKSPRLFPRPAADLRLAVRDTKSAYLRKLYQELEVPHDLVLFAGGDRKERVRPLEHYVGDRAERIKGVELTPFDAEWKAGKAHTVGAATVEKVRHYEQLARAAASEVLANEKDLLRHERLSAAEQLLTSALAFHETARRGDDWKDLGAELRKALFSVLLDQIQEAGERKDWNEVVDLARGPATAYRAEADQVRLAVVLSDLLGKAMNEPPVSTVWLGEVRTLVRSIITQHPNNPATQTVSAKLHEHAGELLRRAKALVDEKQIVRAEELLQLATELDPQSQEVREFRTKLNEFHPALRVGMHELPHFFSPARATTDADLRAVELIFEGLIKMVPGPDGAARFRPGLAAARPRLVPLGREFLLPGNAVWAGEGDKRVTAADVSYSVARLKEGLGGRPKAWGDLLREVVISGDDPNRVALTLTRGILDPLAPMTFKIIPEGTKADDDAFAQKPVGSGPYRLGTTGKDATGDWVSFVSNPAYGSRPGRAGLPHIREIRFYVSKDPVKDVKEGRLDMALDLTAAQAATLANESKVLVPPPGPNRRVYFLAVHHEPGSVLANADFRRGLALAINREELLNQHFRKGWELLADEPRKRLGRSIHHALNSPFPVGSWASPPASSEKSLDPYDPKLAEGLIAKGLEAAGTKQVELELKYPANDRLLTADFWDDLRKQVLKVSRGQVTLKPVAVPPDKLRSALREKNYKLAYWHYDYPDETLSLDPLLGQNGSNDLNYHGAGLQDLINQATARREFDKVRELARKMLGVLDMDMPLIPLWQLDPLSAYREEVKPAFYDRTMGPRKDVERVPYDPLLVFTDAENWRLER